MQWRVQEENYFCQRLGMIYLLCKFVFLPDPISFLPIFFFLLLLFPLSSLAPLPLPPFTIFHYSRVWSRIFFCRMPCAHATQFPALLVHRPVNDLSNFLAFWASQLLLLGKIENTREDIWDLGLTPLMLNFGHLHAFDSPPPPSFDLYMFKNLDLTVWSYLCKRLSVSVFM